MDEIQKKLKKLAKGSAMRGTDASMQYKGGNSPTSDQMGGDMPPPPDEGGKSIPLPPGLPCGGLVGG